MALHPLAERFASVADAYELGRPDYPPAVVGALAAELSLQRGARVLDLAAGTGKLTRALLAGGLDVLAVEPQRQLREMLERAVGAARVRDGLAEAIPLPANAVEAVTVADAFHWFDHARALAEIRRVLRADGGLAVLASAPDWRGAAWGHALGELITRERPPHPQFEGPPWQQALRSSEEWEEPEEVRISASLPASAPRLLAYITSMSWVAAMEPERRARLLEQASELLAASEVPARMPMRFLLTLARPRLD
ncbi:MAG TPA: class I SAM-dependent methyltransferase [Solirubrobacteraceae bacterium]|nr:class I SAM-dependent methyltransferase [Solirubrobacteraceae bacterium]